MYALVNDVKVLSGLYPDVKLLSEASDRLKAFMTLKKGGGDPAGLYDGKFYGGRVSDSAAAG